MNGKLIASLLVASALIAGAAMYYLQVYAFYEDVDPASVDIRLTSLTSGQPEPLPNTGLRAIDADSSPLRFRACFTTPLSLAALTEEFVIYDDPVPLTAPGWFDCFDAEAVGTALEQDRAIAFLAQADIGDGVDRVIAVFDDGRAYAWHQLNDTYE